jgi:hypothetical protein
MSITRRRALSALGAAATLSTDSATGARDTSSAKRTGDTRAIPILDPGFNVKTFGRLTGDLSGRPVYSVSAGSVFGLIPGNDPPLDEYGRLLFTVEGVSVRRCRLRADGSLEERSRGWMLYRSADTGAYIDAFVNPYTGEKLTVPALRSGIQGSVITANGPVVSANFNMESTVFNRPMLLRWRFAGPTAFISRHAFTRWKESSTGIQKTEMTLDNWTCRIADLLDESQTSLPSTTSWTSQTEWQSWLNMRGHPGTMLWHLNASRFKSISDLPPDLVRQCEQVLPGKLTEPLEWT